MNWFPALFGLVIFYPLISVIANWVMGNSKISLHSVWEECRLFAGFSLVFVGAYFVLFLGVPSAWPVWFIFTLYTVAYFVLSVFRKVIWNESKDLFEKKVATA